MGGCLRVESWSHGIWKQEFEPAGVCAINATRHSSLFNDCASASSVLREESSLKDSCEWAAVEAKQEFEAELQVQAAEEQEQQLETKQRKRMQLLLLIKYLVWDVWHPHEPIRIAWDCLQAIAILYAIIITPYIVAFQIDVTGLSHGHAVFDMVINILFMSDILMTFRTAYFSGDGDAVYSRLLIAGHYLKLWFWIDAVASIPWDYAVNEEASLLMLLRLTRTTRVIRVMKLFTFLRTFKRFKISKMFELLESWFGRQRLSITFFVVVVAFSVHWASCLYYFLPSVTGFEEDSWVVRIGIQDEDNVFMYITSAYWAIATMTTVGYGDIVAVRIEEKIVACVIMMAGTSMFAYMMGSVASLIASSSELEAKMTSRMLAIDRFVRAHKIPPALASKMRNYYVYRLERETQDEENEILAGLTDSLRSQLSLFVYKDLLEKIPFFKGKSPTFISSIVPHLHPVYASPGDAIVYQGKEGDEMFFVLEGKLEARLYAGLDPALAEGKAAQDNPVRLSHSSKAARSTRSSFEGTRSRPSTTPPSPASNRPPARDSSTSTAAESRRRILDARSHAWSQSHSTSRRAQAREKGARVCSASTGNARLRPLLSGGEANARLSPLAELSVDPRRWSVHGRPSPVHSPQHAHAPPPRARSVSCSTHVQSSAAAAADEECVFEQRLQQQFGGFFGGVDGARSLVSRPGQVEGGAPVTAVDAGAGPGGGIGGGSIRGIVGPGTSSSHGGVDGARSLSSKPGQSGGGVPVTAVGAGAGPGGGTGGGSVCGMVGLGTSDGVDGGGGPLQPQQNPLRQPRSTQQQPQLARPHQAGGAHATEHSSVTRGISHGGSPGPVGESVEEQHHHHHNLHWQQQQQQWAGITGSSVLSGQPCPTASDLSQQQQWRGADINTVPLGVSPTASEPHLNPPSLHPSLSTPLSSSIHSYRAHQRHHPHRSHITSQTTHPSQQSKPGPLYLHHPPSPSQQSELGPLNLKTPSLSNDHLHPSHSLPYTPNQHATPLDTFQEQHSSPPLPPPLDGHAQAMHTPLHEERVHGDASARTFVGLGWLPWSSRWWRGRSAAGHTPTPTTHAGPVSESSEPVIKPSLLTLSHDLEQQDTVEAQQIEDRQQLHAEGAQKERQPPRSSGTRGFLSRARDKMRRIKAPLLGFGEDPQESNAFGSSLQDAKHTVLATYHPGDFFGELACLKRKPHPATIVALDFSYMYCLKLEVLEGASEMWPEVRKDLQKMVMAGQHHLRHHPLSSYHVRGPQTTKL